MEKIRTQSPKALSPSLWRIKGERKIPIATEVAKPNQFELMFRRACTLRFTTSVDQKKKVIHSGLPFSSWHLYHWLPDSSTRNPNLCQRSVGSVAMSGPVCCPSFRRFIAE